MTGTSATSRTPDLPDAGELLGWDPNGFIEPPKSRTTPPGLREQFAEALTELADLDRATAPDTRSRGR